MNVRIASGFTAAALGRDQTALGTLMPLRETEAPAVEARMQRDHQNRREAARSQLVPSGPEYARRSRQTAVGTRMRAS